MRVERNWVGPCESHDATTFALNTPYEQFTGPWNEAKLHDLHSGTEGKPLFDGYRKILAAAVAAGNTELNQPFTHCEQWKCKLSLMSIYVAQGLKMGFTFFLPYIRQLSSWFPSSPGFALSTAHFVIYLLFSTAGQLGMACVLIDVNCFSSHKRTAPVLAVSFNW